MIELEKLTSISKDDLQEVSKALSKEDISKLIEILSLKDDNIRYQAFLLLQNRSIFFDDVYPYWDIFKNKLISENSYQRSIGLMMISENVKWDIDNRMEDTIDDYLLLLNDEKPITIRQCIQALSKIVSVKPSLSEKIASRLISVDLMVIKETMRKIILIDIIDILLLIRKDYKPDEIENYIKNALLGEILDIKAKKQIEKSL